MTLEQFKKKYGEESVGMLIQHLMDNGIRPEDRVIYDQLIKDIKDLLTQDK